MTKISKKGIEKAAWALCVAEGHKDPETLICPAFDHDNPRPRWTFYAEDARAAIAAYLDATGAPTSDPAPAGWRDGNKPLPFDRETLGRMVREAWVRWAQTQPAPKPSWLAPYDELTEADKEADRQIGESIARWTLIGDASRNCLAAAPEPPVSDGRLAHTYAWSEAAAYRAGQIAQAEGDAKILREQFAEATRPDQRMTLAIAIRAIERGRNLTKVEQMKNLMDAIAEFDREEAARLRAKGDLK